MRLVNADEVIKKLEEFLELTRKEQTIECIKHNGYGTPLQSKNNGKIEAIILAINIVDASVEE